MKKLIAMLFVFGLVSIAVGCGAKDTKGTMSATKVTTEVTKSADPPK